MSNSIHLPIGYKIGGQYEILEAPDKESDILGQGGFGIVYFVKDIKNKDKHFVVKELFLLEYSLRYRDGFTVGTNKSIDHKLNVLAAVSAPRMHHQWLPDKIRIEEGFSPDTIKLLEEKGHEISKEPAMGAIQSILIEDGKFYGGADPRRSTSSAQGY